MKCPPAGTSLEAKLARLGHRFLYVLLIAVPLTRVVAGLNRKGLDFFGYQIAAVAQNKELAHALKELHEGLANLLLAVLGIHLAATAWQGLRGHKVLQRML